MLKRQVTKDAEKTMDKMPDKHFCQVYDAVEALRENPEPENSKALFSNVTPKRRRKDTGEYRIIYWYDDEYLYIDVVGKRNDGDVYKNAKRKGIIMNTVNATYAKQNFGACVADAAKQPVVIEKSGRPAVVMISYEEFQRLNELDESMWLQRAQESAANGYLSADKSDEFMKKRLERAISKGLSLIK